MKGVAMSSVNKVILIGNLGRDPELRYTQSGQAVANFSIATSEMTGKDDARQRVTEWHSIVVWGKMAEVARQYLRKGRSVYVEGRIQSRRYTDRNGVERTAYEIVAGSLQFLGGTNGQTPNDTPSAYHANAHGLQPMPDAVAGDGDIPF